MLTNTLRRLTPAPKKPSAGATRVEFVDALRGIAVLLIVIYHTGFMSLIPINQPYWFSSLLPGFSVSLALIFAISVYSLLMTMPAHLAKPRPWTSFYIHRAFRILPLYYAVLIFVVFINLPGANAPSLRLTVESVLLLQNLDVTNRLEGIYPVSWTLGAEMLLYLVFPLLVRYATSIVRSLVVIAATSLIWLVIQRIAIGLLNSPTDLQFFSVRSAFATLPSFAFGFLIYRLIAKNRSLGTDDGASRDRANLLIIGGLLLLGFQFSGYIPNLAGPGWLLMTAVCVPICVGLAANPTAILVNKFTQHCGKIAYSIYLLHPIVIPHLRPVYERIQQTIHNPSLSLAIVLLATIATTVLAATVTYRVIERPGMLAGRWVANRLMPETASH